MYLFKESSSSDIRIDTGITKNTEIKSFFDPMICKLIVWDIDRELAAKKMVNALNDFIIHGIKTNITYLIALLQSDAFVQNQISTKFCDQHTPEVVKGIETEKEKIPITIPLIAYSLYTLNDKTIQERKHSTDEHNVWNIIGYWREVMTVKILYCDKEYNITIDSKKGNQYVFEIEGQKYQAELKENVDNRLSFFLKDKFYLTYISEDSRSNAFLSFEGHIFSLLRKDILIKDNSVFRMEDFVADTNNITSPMPGKVIKVNVMVGDEVKKGDVLIIIEAMKMENRIFATKDCKIQKIGVKAGDMVETTTSLISLEE
jgi:3-methylcrotonyl-CoA carboxylase alpha subunit